MEAGSTFKLKKHLDSIDLRYIFDSYDHRFNWRRVHFVCFNTLSNCKSIGRIDCYKLAKWFEASIPDRILKRYANESYRQKNRRLLCEDVAYILTDGILVHLDMHRDSVAIFFSESQVEAQSLFESAMKFKKRTSAQDINIIVTDHDGLSLKSLKSKRVSLELNEHYNDELNTHHPTLIKALRKQGANGLVLFHGEPGTGKSTYLRYLAGFLRKQIIFLSPRLAKNLDDPGFARLLIDNPNSIVIIEDAEDLLVARDSSHDSGISTLLNLTDGLLGTSIGIQFICTFNTPVTNIDKALLRKGRLLALYEFGPLSIAKSKALLQKLGHADFEVAMPMTLADIYNVEKPAYQLEPKRRSIGFGACVA